MSLAYEIWYSNITVTRANSKRIKLVCEGWGVGTARLLPHPQNKIYKTRILQTLSHVIRFNLQPQSATHIS
jgi:hypothetical protein